jgi:hypothetical protein
MRKTLWTLNIGNYAPELCELTYPLLLGYARKIGADFQIINERRFPEMPVVYEKLQIFYLGAANDWNVYIDSDAIISPDMLDITERLNKDTVAHYSCDHASNRWKYDHYFRRDGRDIGSCNWFAAASDWCMDLWHPLEDLSLEQARRHILPIIKERKSGITRDHLIDDYVLSRNIAKYGLKVKTMLQIQTEDRDQGMYAFHRHTVSLAEKVKETREAIKVMGIGDLDEFRETGHMTAREWIAQFGSHIHMGNTIGTQHFALRTAVADVEDMRTQDELQPCNGMAPQDHEPCALALGHAGPHSDVGPYRNKPRSMERRASR